MQSLNRVSNILRSSLAPIIIIIITTPLGGHHLLAYLNNTPRARNFLHTCSKEEAGYKIVIAAGFGFRIRDRATEFPEDIASSQIVYLSLFER